MTSSSELIKESFDPKLISALYKNFSDQYVALLELIDNAVDDKAENNDLIVEILISDSSVTIKNHGGKGMGQEELVNFFKWGVSNKQKRIGRYGQGGKAALGYLGKGFSIKTHPENGRESYFLQVENWQDRSDGFKEIKIEPYSSTSRMGTVDISVTNLQKKFNPEIIARKITETYRPLILKNQVVFVVGSDELKCPPANYDPGTKRSFDIPFVVEEAKYRLYGEYGIVPDTNSPTRGGFNIYQFGRRVAKGEFFGHRDPSKKWNLERLYGELFIDFEVPLLMNKTDADRDSHLWRKIIELMKRETESIIRSAADYKKPTEKEIKPVVKIKKKLQKAGGHESFDIELTNYGPSQLFKLKRDEEDKTKLLINREHKAYQRWSATAAGKQLYVVMVYSLYSAIQNLPKKQAAELEHLFSKSLAEQTHKLL